MNRPSNSQPAVCFVHKLIYDYRLSFYRLFASNRDRMPGEMEIIHSSKRMLCRDGDPVEVSVRETVVLGLRWQWLDVGRLHRTEVVVALFDVHYLSSIMHCIMRPRSVIWIWWGIGFGGSWIANMLRVILAQMSDGVALYMPRAVRDFSAAGVPRRLLFCAPNTVHVLYTRQKYSGEKRKNIVFFGGLKFRKRVDLLIDAYAMAYRAGIFLGNLEIVGDGACFAALQKQASDLNISHTVLFHGNLYDGPELTAVFSRALAMVSPGQAGLSILHCFAHGVPVVVGDGAISGGELDNIHDLQNGIVYGRNRKIKDLEAALYWIALNQDRVIEMGKAAALYYQQNMTIEHLLNAFNEGIKQASVRLEGTVI